MDQRLGEWRVYDHQWQQLGRWVAAESRPATHGGIRLKSNQGGWRVENLKVLNWQGVENPQQQAPTEPGILLADGKFLAGRITHVDAASKKILLHNGKDETTVGLDEVQAVRVQKTHAASHCNTTIIFRSGTRLFGNWRGVQQGWIDLESAEQDRSWKVRLDRVEVVRFRAARDGEGQGPPEGLSSEVLSGSTAAGPTARLEWQGGRLHGRLSESQHGAVLCWQMAGAEEPVGIVGRPACRIVFRDQPVVPNPKVPPPPQPNDMVGNMVAGLPRISIAELLKKSVLQPLGEKGRTLLGARLYLRNGDILPVGVHRIDDQGIHIEALAIEGKLIPHPLVKALVFLRPGPPPLNKLQHSRLMTLPRMQRTNPPRHLIAAVNGDFLRGRLLELNQQRAVIDVQLESHEIPLDRISHIICLHEDEYAIREDRSGSSQQPSDAPVPMPSSADKGLGDVRVQVVMPDNLTLTFTLTSVRGDRISGYDPYYGQCSVSLRSGYELKVTHPADQAALAGTLALWKLQPAPDPTTLQRANSEVPAGLRHPLVGKQAPEFRLPSPDGKEIALEQFRGQVVVLDFWASWCGPCLVAMPQVEKVVEKFSDKVRLVAVNLQETPERVRTTLERLRVNPLVAIDEDGAMAAKYHAAAIPQTVIIDRQGKVVRVFVGGGTDFVEQLADALREVLAAD